MRGQLTTRAMRPVALMLLGAVAACAPAPAAAQQKATPAPRANPAAASAAPWSVRMAESVMRRDSIVHREWDYTAGLVLLAIERVGVRTGERRFHEYVQRNMERLVEPSGAIRTYEIEEFNLDQINQGRLLFPLRQRTGDARWARAADTLRAQLARHPRTREGGFWHKKIYPHQMWLDGLYMAQPFYAEYAVQHGDTAALSDVTRQFLLVARHTRDPRTGLMYHAWDESRSQKWADSLTGLSRNFWGRAMGWYMMGLVDALDFIPPGHPDRAQLVRLLQETANAVVKVQDPVTGLWYQVLDMPNRAGNYHEASASSMFVYALAKGARMGWLDASHAAAAQRGYAGIIRHLVTVDANGLVSLNRICQVAGLGGRQQRDGSFEYYISEPIVSNDHKGVGAFVMASLEVGQ